MKYIIIISLVFLSSVLYSQGTIRGVLLDKESQTPLIGGVVTIENSSGGAVTDIEGAYSISLPAGIYTVNHTYVGYQTKQISNVEVIDGEVVSLGSISLGTGTEIETVVVTAYTQTNTEEGLLNKQRNSSKIIDAISAQSIAKTGDSDVAAVVKRVPGVTIEGGKYVYVRGLGDRYSKSMLNGMELPGLDPERNTVQMDIFSSNIVDNIVVYKTFSPDLPGDFTGGMVDVITKDFPQEQFFNISVSTGYNTEATFDDNFLGVDSSFADGIGFGKSNRELPFSKSFEPVNATRSELFTATNHLNKNIDVNPIDNTLNHKINASYGSQKELAKGTIGYVAGLNYSKDFSQRANWNRNNIAFVNEVEDENFSSYRLGTVSSTNGLLNGFVNTAYKTNHSKIGLKLLHTRTGETSVSMRQEDDRFNVQLFDEDIVDYFQRTLSNATLDSEFYLGKSKDQVLTATLSGTFSTVDNPERTETSMFIDPVDGSYSFASNSEFNKEWRELNEYAINAKANYEIPLLSQRNQKSKLKFGMSSLYKERDFEPVQVEIAPSNFFDASLVQLPSFDLNYILQEENIINEGKDGYTINSVKIDQENSFTADMMINAGYVMTDYKVNDQLKFIGGIRAEHATMNYNGFSAGSVFNEETLNSIQLLPSANLVYELREFMNMRASYNRTLARPSFKEKSQVNIFDAILDQFFIGNINLEETTIDNYDLRWEYYFDYTELVSISPFYKQFQNPIEMSFINSNQITPINKNEASVLGFEFELRKDFGFINKSWENVSVNTNVTVTNSTIELTDNEKLKYENPPTDRSLMGQAPYTINASLAYASKENGWNANLGYNVKGKTLSVVGFSTQSLDIYEDPFHNLDLKLSKQLQDKLGSTISLSAGNLLKDNIDYYYEINDSRKQSFETYEIGQTFSLSYSLSIK